VRRGARHAVEHSFGFTAAPGIPLSRPAPPLRPALSEGRILTVSAAIHVVSEANTREHHMVKARRAKGQRHVAAAICRTTFGAPPGPPLFVLLTRIAPRELDSDNLAGAFKAVRDGIADWLEINDRDKRVRWSYGQEKGDPKSYAIRIEISRLLEGP
jgi:hypothetical protein